MADPAPGATPDPHDTPGPDAVDPSSSATGGGGDDTAERRPVGLGPVGWARWAWRQLTSMPTALGLLLLLAVAAVPGSVFPQRNTDSSAVDAYLVEHPDLGPWLDRLHLFDVFASPWFASVYLLLFVSLIGCVLPRTAVHLRAVRAAPPATPRRLGRLPSHVTATVDASVDDALEAARQVLAGRRFRTRVLAGDSVAAQRGYLAETGNLVFHLALVLVLVAVAAGSRLSYSGQAIVVQGGTFANTVTQYNTFSAGSGVDTGSLTPFSFTLDDFEATYETQTGQQFGAARSFEADVTVTDAPGATAHTEQLTVNDPVDVDGTRVFLTANGYAPVVTVRDGDGDVVRQGAVVFVPQDTNYTSTGVVKVPDASPQQLAFQGLFLPTAYFGSATGPTSIFPTATFPCLVLTAFTAEPGTDGLGTDDGSPQSVYTLDTTDEDLEQVTATAAEVAETTAASACSSTTSGDDATGEASGDDATGSTDDGASGASDGSAADDATEVPLQLLLAPGETVQLPDGLGSITFDGVRRYVAVDVRYDPTKGWALAAALLALLGVTLSLYIRQFRVWVRARPDGQGRTVVEVAGLALSQDQGLSTEIAAVLKAVQQRTQGEP